MNPYEISQSPERKAYRSSEENSASSLAIKIFNRNDDDYVIKLCGSKNNNRRRSKSTVRQAAGACEPTCQSKSKMLRNLYRSTFGPTLDETVLVGLETFHLSRQPGGADETSNANNEMCWDCSTLLPTNRNSRQYESVTTSTTNSLLDKGTNLSSLVTNECQYHPTSSQSRLTTTPSADSIKPRQPRQPRSSNQKSGSIGDSTNISSTDNLTSASLRSTRRRKDQSSQELLSKEPCFQEVSGVTPKGPIRGSFTKEPSFQEVSGTSPKGPMRGSITKEPSFQEVSQGPLNGSKRGSQQVNGTSPEGPIKGFFSRLSKGKVFGCHNPDEIDIQECLEDCECDSATKILEENLRKFNRGPSPPNFGPSPTNLRQNSLSSPKPGRNENGIARSSRDRGSIQLSPDDPKRCDPDCDNFAENTRLSAQARDLNFPESTRLSAQLQQNGLNGLSEPPIMCPPCCPVHRSVQKSMPKRNSFSTGASKRQPSVEIDLKGQNSTVAVTLGSDEGVDIDLSVEDISKIMMYSPEKGEIDPRKNRRSIEEGVQSENKTPCRSSRDRSVPKKCSCLKADPNKESQETELRRSRRLSPYRETSRPELTKNIEPRSIRKSSLSRSNSLSKDRPQKTWPEDEIRPGSRSSRTYPKRHSCIETEDNPNKKEHKHKKSRRSSPVPLPQNADPTKPPVEPKEGTQESTEENNNCCRCIKPKNEEIDRQRSRRHTGGCSPLPKNEDIVSNTEKAKHRHRNKDRKELRAIGESETQENALCPRISEASDNQSEKLRNNMAQETRYAITRVTKYDDFTTYEVLKSTRAKPRKIPEVLEKIFIDKEQ